MGKVRERLMTKVVGLVAAIVLTATLLAYTGRETVALKLIDLAITIANGPLSGTGCDHWRHR